MVLHTYQKTNIFPTGAKNCMVIAAETFDEGPSFSIILKKLPDAAADEFQELSLVWDIIIIL